MITADPVVRERRSWRTWVASSAALAIAAGGVGWSAAPANAAVSADAAVVINEVYGGGGNNGAPFDRDFVELRNTSDAAVSLDGWSVQYASSTGANWQVTTLAGATIEPRGHLLIGQAVGANADLPGFTADIDGSIPMSGTQGKVALVSSCDALSGDSGLAQNDAVVDYVGWGNATDFAGTAAAPATTNATSIARDAAAGNTADNGADFTAGTPTPQGAGGTTPEQPGEPEEPGEPEPPVDPTTVTIAEIQGTGDATPLAGSTVTTEGVVTAHYPTGGYNGYVIQTAGTGGAYDPARVSSDAVFVYTRTEAVASEVALGENVRVTGVPSEFNGLTQLTVEAGAAVRLDEPVDAPSPVVLAEWPSDVAAREALESMLVEVDEEFTVSNTYSTGQYGEVGLATGDTPLRQPTDAARPGSPEAAAIAADNLARGVILDDGGSLNYAARDRQTDALHNGDLIPAYLSLTEPPRVGGAAKLDGAFVLDYRNNAWKLNPTQFVAGDATGANDQATFSGARPAAPALVGGDLSVASFNVLNYFTTLGADDASCEAYTDRSGNGVNVQGGCPQRGAWGVDDLERQQSKIVAAINTLDASVVGLMEIEDSSALGEEADEATATLVAALNAASQPGKWAFVPSSTELPAASSRDVITNAIIYQPALVERVGEARALGTLSSDDEAFGNAREPIAQAFAPVGGWRGVPLRRQPLQVQGVGGPVAGRRRGPERSGTLQRIARAPGHGPQPVDPDDTGRRRGRDPRG
ncbi:MAG: ExeM/NucH family extracellular endonuclease [Microbacterium arborescens]